MKRRLTKFSFLLLVLLFLGLSAPVQSLADTVTLSLYDFVIFSGGGSTPNIQTNYETRIGGHTTVYGNIGSNQDLTMIGGQDTSGWAQVYGSVYVGGYLNMGQPLTVGSSNGPLREIVVNGGDDGAAPANAHEADFIGDLYGNMYVTGQSTGSTVHLGTQGNIYKVGGTGGNLEWTGGTTDATAFPAVGWNVEGTVTSPSTKTFALINMPAETDLSGFTNTQGDQAPAAGAGEELTLVPNTLATGYGALTAAQNQIVNLQSGNYYFESIDTLDGLTLNIDLSSGNPINVYVVGNANFKQTTLKVKGAGTGGAYLPIDDESAQALAGLIYWETHGIFDIRGAEASNRGLFGGTVYASLLEENTATSGEVTVGQYYDWYGAVWAFDSVYIMDHGTWNHVPLGAPIPEPASMLLFGSGLIGAAAVIRRRFKR